MTRTLRRTTLAAPLVLLAATASGCGIGSDAARPGMAASVEDTNIPLSRVDDATTSLCDLSGEGALAFYEQGRYDGIVDTPRALLRQQVGFTFILQAVVEQIVEERGLTVPDEVVAGVRSGLEDVAGADAVADFLEAETYINTAVTIVGESEAESAADPTAAGEAGLAVLTDWMTSHDVVINPVLDLEVGEDGLSPATDDELSVPVSDEAGAAVIDFDDPAVEDKIAALAESLPADQVCGA